MEIDKYHHLGKGLFVSYRVVYENGIRGLGKKVKSKRYKGLWNSEF